MVYRMVEKSINESLSVSRVVHLTGIRQCGKTTLVESLPLAKKSVRSLDDAMQRGREGRRRDTETPSSAAACAGDDG